MDPGSRTNKNIKGEGENFWHKFHKIANSVTIQLLVVILTNVTNKLIVFLKIMTNKLLVFLTNVTNKLLVFPQM